MIKRRFSGSASRRILALSIIGVELLASRSRAQDLIWRWDGPSAFTALGYAVSGGGDVDGDGFADLIVGTTNTLSGTAYVYSGASGVAIYALNGEGASDRFGLSVSDAGDLDADGFGDFVVGAPDNDVGGSDAGRAYAYSGRTGSLLFTFTGGAADIGLGHSVSRAGDVDSDGTEDLIIGSEAEVAIVYSGTTGGLIYTFSNSTGAGGFGWVVSKAGDVDRDGHDDLLVGAPFNSDSGNSAGKVFIYSGQSGAVLWAANGNGNLAQFGWTLSDAGDVDRDGFADFIIGAPGEDLGNGRMGKAYVYSGMTGLKLYDFQQESGKANQFGWSVSGAGDVNRDGFPDFVVGAPDFASSNVFGEVYVYGGKKGGLIYRITGEQKADLFGWSVSGAGDVDRDTSADVIAGARLNNSGGTAAGRAYVYAGIRLPLLRSVTPARTVYNTALSVTLDGQNFTKGTNTQVLFGAQAASNVVVVDDKTITCDVPTGMPGPVDVTVTNSLGSNTLAQGFDYTPSIRLDGNFVPGGMVTIHYLVICGDETFGILGAPPPVNLPTPPFFGSLCIFPFLFVPLPPCDPSIQEIDLTGTIPNDPTLSGTQLLLQALSGPSITHKPKDAAWTNCAVLEIQ